MNRFEIIAERIGVIGKGIPNDVSGFNLKSSVEKLYGSLQDESFDLPIEAEYVKMQITDVLYDLLLVASKYNHCGACMCGDLEEKLRGETERVQGISITVMPPMVVNENNVPGNKRYKIFCDVFNEEDPTHVVSVIHLPVEIDTPFADNPFYTQLCADLKKSTSLDWFAEKVGGLVALKTHNNCHEVNLTTRCSIYGEKILKI